MGTGEGRPPSHTILSSSVSRLGAKRVAEELGVSSALVYKWCPPTESTGSGTPNPLDRIEKLIALAGDSEIVDWLCGSAGGFFTKNPQKNLDSGDLFKNIQRLVKEFSDTLDAITA